MALETILTAAEVESLDVAVRSKIEDEWKKKSQTVEDLKIQNEKLQAKFDQQSFDLESQLRELREKALEHHSKVEQLELEKRKLETELSVTAERLSSASASLSEHDKNVQELQRQKEKLIADNTELTSLLSRRNDDVDRLTTECKSLTDQLISCNREKAEVAIRVEEIDGKELALQYKEKRLEQEKELLGKQHQQLLQELESRNQELLTIRRDQATKTIEIQSELAETIEELRISQETVSHFKSVNEKQAARIEELVERVKELRDNEAKLQDVYRQELRSQTKIAELHKASSDEAQGKVDELLKAVEELQKLLWEASSRYGELETKSQAEITELKEKLDNSSEAIEALKKELATANALLESTRSSALNESAIEAMSPAAAAASRLLKSGMTLTQIYGQYVSVSEQLLLKEEENKRLNNYIDQILEEIQERAPAIARQREDYERSLEIMASLRQQLDSAVEEASREKLAATDAQRQLGQTERLNKRLQQQVADLGKQVRSLVREVEQLRGNFSLAESEDVEVSSANAAQQIISQRLVAFKNIEELQQQNQQLLAALRELSDKEENEENAAVERRTSEVKEALEKALGEIEKLREARRRQEEMVESIVRQRDMYKMLLQEVGCSPVDESGSPVKLRRGMPVTSTPAADSQRAEPTEGLIQLQESLDEMKKKLDEVQQSSSAVEKELRGEINRLKEQVDNEKTQSTRLATQLDYAEERVKAAMNNMDSYKRQATALEEKNRLYSSIINKHERSIEILKDEAMSAQQKLAKAEVTLSMLQQERNLLKDAEQRLVMERDSLLAERKNQNLILSNLEEIKLNLDRGESENRMRMQNTIESLENERNLLRKKLDAEAERYRETVQTWEKLLQQEKEAVQAAVDRAMQAEAVAAELQETGSPADAQGKAALARKVQVPRPSSSSGPSVDVGELRTQLSEARTELEALREQLRVSRQHVEQYRSISDSMEKELRESNESTKVFKEETKKRIEQLTAERASLAEQLQQTQQQLEVAEQAASNFEAQLSDRLNPLQSRVEDLEAQLRNAQQQVEQAQTTEAQARQTCTEQIRVAQEAQEKYERELVQHAADIAALNTMRQQLDELRSALGESQQNLTKVESELNEGKASWETQKQILLKEAAENAQHCADLEKQSDILQQQLLTMSTQLASITQAQGGNRSLNSSFTEDEAKSSDQLLELIRFLRREKEIAASRAESAQAEASRIKTQLEQAERQIKDLEATLSREQERSAASVITTSKHMELMRKLETLNALTDSNRLLREERDALKLNTEDLSSKIQALQAELTPLKEKNEEISGRNEELTAENQTLRKQLTTWRSRANALQERAGKASAEEIRKLQQEKEALQKNLEQLKESNNKFQADVNTLNTQVAAGQQKLQEETRKLKEEIQKLQTENSSQKETETKREEEFTKQADQLNQLRRIARKYKTQFEETKAELDKCKSEAEKAATEAAAAPATAAAAPAPAAEETAVSSADAAKLKELEQEIAALKEKADQLKNENQVLNEANEKLKAMLKKARQNITSLKESHVKEVEETKAKLETLEQSAEEASVRAAALRSQLEGRIARMERENAEVSQEKERLEREVETLTQRTGVLQHQMEACQKLLNLAQQKEQQQAKSTAEKSPAENPPTANIRPIASTTVPAQRQVVAAQPVVSGTSGNQRTTPTASIRPMAMQTRTAAVLPMASVTITPAVAMAAVQALREEEPSTSVLLPEETEEPVAGTSAPEEPSTSRPGPSVGKRKRTTEEEAETVVQEPEDRTKRVHVEEIVVSDDEAVEIHLQEGDMGEAEAAEYSAGREEGEIEEEERQMASEDEAMEETGGEEEAEEAAEEEQEEPLDTLTERQEPDQTNDSIQIIHEESAESHADAAQAENTSGDTQEAREPDTEPGVVNPDIEPEQEPEILEEAPGAPSGPAGNEPTPGPAAPARQERLPVIARPTLPYEDTGDDSIVPSTPVLLRPRTNDGFAEAVSSPQVPTQFVFGPSDSVVLVPTTQQPSLSQLATQGMEDTRVDLSQLEESSSARSVPSTPLQVSPPTDAQDARSGATASSEGETNVPSIVVSSEEEERRREMEADANIEMALLGEDDTEIASEQRPSAPAESQDAGADAGAPEGAAPTPGTQRVTRQSGHPRGPRSSFRGSSGRGVAVPGDLRSSASRPVPIVWGSEPQATGQPAARGTGRGLRRPVMLPAGDQQGPASSEAGWTPQRARRSRGRRGGQ